MDGLENEVKNEVEIDKLGDEDSLNEVYGDYEDCDELREFFEMIDMDSLPENQTQTMLWHCGMDCPDICPDGKDGTLDQLIKKYIISIILSPLDRK